MSDARNVDPDGPVSMSDPTSNGSDPTLDWMIRDVARRCHEVRDVLRINGSGADPVDGSAVSTVRLGDAAFMLRSAADDLASVVELIEGPAATDVVDQSMPAFGLAFRRDSPDTTP